MLLAFQARRAYFARLGVIVCILLVVLAACNERQGSPAPKAQTPVGKRTATLSPTTLANASPTSTTNQGSADWTTYHHDSTRTGYLAGAPDPQQFSKAWTAKLDGAVYAEPLVVAGHVIVATENDTLYSLDPASGDVLWHTNVGTPVAQATLPCGDIDPLGITGTPVYDPATGLVFAVAEVSGPQHILVGLDVTSGTVHVQRQVDVPSMDPRTHQQRAALLLSKDMVYIAYGGLAGDCANYHGTVVGSRTDGKGDLLSYQVPVTREGGIWAPSGPALDADGHVYVAVGNGETTSGAWDHSDSVLRLSSTLTLEDAFAPSSWQEENKADADLGSMGPTLLPAGLLFIAGKSGMGYLLHANALGGIGGQISSAQICNGLAMGGTAAVASQIFVPCSDGLRSVTVDSDLHLTTDWHVVSSGPPIVGGQTVYNLDAHGTLYAYALDTGTLRAQIKLEDLPHFSTPTIFGGHIFVPTYRGIIAVNIL